MSHLYRGDAFQVLIAEIGDLRSLLPKSVKVLALTATSTHETLKCITSHLSLEDSVIIGLPPDRSNIKYTIRPVVPILHLCNKLNDGTFIATNCYAKNFIFEGQKHLGRRAQESASY